MSTWVEKNENSNLLKKKTKRKTQSKLTREINNLRDFWERDQSDSKRRNVDRKMIKGKMKESEMKNKLRMRVKNRNRKEISYLDTNLSKEKKRKSHPISHPHSLNKIENSLMNNCHRYTFSSTTPAEIFFSLSDILQFLKFSFGIDYENYILKDEQKQEFKVNLNKFLKDYTTIYNSSRTLILVKHSYIFLLFEIISKFINYTSDELCTQFEEISRDFKEKKLKEKLDYIKPIAFACENQIKIEETNKKKVGHYAKYKTIPKWHHYAWDMINQISNSRKSFIFSQLGIEEALNQETNKRRIDLATITLKLKLKIYNNIFEFIDELMKMIKFSTDINNKNGNSKNVAFCKMIETRMQKQIKKLKDENKI